MPTAAGSSTPDWPSRKPPFWDGIGCCIRTMGERTWSAWKRATESGTTFEIEHRLKRSSDGSYRWHLVRAVPLRTSNGEITSWLGTCTEIEDQKRAESATFEEQKLKEIGRLAGGCRARF